MLQTTTRKMKKKKMLMRSDSKTISEGATTEAAVTTTTEEIEEEQTTSTPMPIEGANKPPNIEVTPTGEDTLTEEIEEETPSSHLNKHFNKTQQINKDKNQRKCADIERNQDTQLKTAGLYKPRTRPEE